MALREALDGPESRAALRSLLGDRRLQVGPDPERGFRVDGLLEVEIESGSRPGCAGPGRLARDVAGGRYVRDEPVLLDEYAPLPWAA